MGFEDDLKGRRAGIATEIAELRARAAMLESVLASFDEVIRYYDPTATVAAAPTKARTAPQPLPPQLQRLNKTDAVFETLREAGRPISTGECTASIGQQHGVDLADPALRRFSSHVSATLSALAKRNRVRQILGSPDGRPLWEVAT